MESHSPAVLPRAVTAMVERSLKVAPVVVLSGARQTGKTTLVRSLAALRDRPYLTLDDLDLRVQADLILTRSSLARRPSCSTRSSAPKTFG
jgi:predicted AAA+ superfamily ATPase